MGTLSRKERCCLSQGRRSVGLQRGPGRGPAEGRAEPTLPARVSSRKSELQKVCFAGKQNQNYTLKK